MQAAALVKESPEVSNDVDNIIEPSAEPALVPLEPPVAEAAEHEPAHPAAAVLEDPPVCTLRIIHNVLHEPVSLRNERVCFKRNSGRDRQD